MAVATASLGYVPATHGGGGPADPVVIVFVIVVLVVLGFVGAVRNTGRSRKLLDEWALRHGYRILSRESRSFFRGPYFWSSGKDHDVYRILAESCEGARRDGWARVGKGFLWWPGRVDVRWDPLPRPPPPTEEGPRGFPVIMPGDRTDGRE